MRIHTTHPLQGLTFIPHPGLPPKYSHTCWTPWSVFQDGSFEAIPPGAGAMLCSLSPPDPGPKLVPRSPAPSRPASHPHTSNPHGRLAPVYKGTRRGAAHLPGPSSGPANRPWLDSPECMPRGLRLLHHRTLNRPAPLAPSVSLLTISRAFNSLFKVLFIFPSRYLFAIGLLPLFSLRWRLPPALSCNPKQLDSLSTPRTHSCPLPRRDSHPLRCPVPWDLSKSQPSDSASIDYNSDAKRRLILNLSSSRFTRRY